MGVRLQTLAVIETVKAIQEMKRNGVFYIKTLGAGAATTVVTAADLGLGMPRVRREDGYENQGEYLIDCQRGGKACARAVWSDEAEKLSMLSEELVKEKFACDGRAVNWSVLKSVSFLFVKST